MTLEEKIAMANQVRSRDRFGPVSPEELAALPGTETELWIETANGCEIHVFEERPAVSVRWMLIANSSGSIYNKVT